MTSEDPITKNPPNFLPALGVSAVIILLWVIPVFVLASQAGRSGSGVWGIVSIIALLATVFAPLLYGWFTGDLTGAIIVGALPFPLVTGVSRVLFLPGQTGADFLVYTVVYIVVLGLVGGLEGYFAAKKTQGNLLIAILLAGIWAGIFLSGIN
jgi:hypothetical protein